MLSYRTDIKLFDLSGMGEFLDQCRKGQIKHPASRGYSIEVWVNNFKSCHDKDSEDFKLFDAGLWFNKRFETMRAILKTADLSVIDQTTYKKAVVAALNFQLHMVRWHLEAKAEAQGFNDGNMIDVDGFESVINAGRHLLAEKGPFSKEHTTVRQGHLDMVNGLMMLGIQYDNHDATFLKCLWQGWQVAETRSVDVFGPSDDEKEKSKALAWQRYQWLIVSNERLLAENWKELDITFREHHARYRWEVSSISRKGHWFDLDLGKPHVHGERPPLLVSLFTVSEEAMFKPFLLQRLPKFPELDLSLLFETFAVLASLAHKLREGIPVTPFIPETIPLFCPIITRTQLDQVITTSQGIDSDVASQVIHMFEFRGTEHDDLYLKPLVPIDDDSFALVLPPFVIPNTTWLLEHWMREGELKPNAKGKAYEKEVRKSLISACTLNNAEVLGKAIILDKGPLEEEIDLIVRIGNKVLVGDVKCSSFPTRPQEVFNYENLLHDGAKQVLRKVERARTRKDVIIALFQRPMDDSRGLEFIPFLLTNVPFGVGQTYCDVPVTDLLSLSNYLHSGQLDGYAELETPEGLFRDKQTVMLYSSEREAEENILNHLLRPASLKINERLVKETKKPWLPLPDCKPAEGRRFDVISQVRPRSEWGKPE